MHRVLRAFALAELFELAHAPENAHAVGSYFRGKLEELDTVMLVTAPSQSRKNLLSKQRFFA